VGVIAVAPWVDVVGLAADHEARPDRRRVFDCFDRAGRQEQAGIGERVERDRRHVLVPGDVVAFMPTTAAARVVAIGVFDTEVEVMALGDQCHQLHGLRVEVIHGSPPRRTRRGRR
jgi:hypothetical protein